MRRVHGRTHVSGIGAWTGGLRLAQEVSRLPGISCNDGGIDAFRCAHWSLRCCKAKNLWQAVG